MYVDDHVVLAIIDFFLNEVFHPPTPLKPGNFVVCRGLNLQK